MIFGQEKEIKIKCDKIIRIDSLEFYKNKIEPVKINKEKQIDKEQGNLFLKTKDSTITFRDNTSVNDFFQYSYLGQFKELNSDLILGQDYNQNYYYLISQTTNKEDTLVGYPLIFKNKILAIEGAYTDGSALIEIWNIKDHKVQKEKIFSLKDCMIYTVQKAYLRDKYLYINNFLSTDKNNYYKIHIK